jgi:hypothetical protein
MASRPDTRAFIRIFNEIPAHRHRHDVFRDFVTMVAISLHNAIRKSATLEAEYLSIIGRYDRVAQQAFPKLLGELVKLLDPEPRDVLGELYMSLEFGNTHAGQFFTPPEVLRMMAELAISEQLDTHEFITISEPACGSGGMVLAIAGAMLEAKRNPAEVMWVECQDVDRSVAMMCYVQLALWNIPGVVIVGNTLAMEVREAFYTPAHWLGFWDAKLKRREREGRGIALTESLALDPIEKELNGLASSVVAASSSVSLALPTQNRRGEAPRQLEFDFEL